MTHLLTLYFLDSGSYYTGVWDWFGIFHPTEYDYLRQDQIDWFLQESCTYHVHYTYRSSQTHNRLAAIDSVERPFTPDGAKDLGGIWARQNGQVIPGERRLAKPNALMFFHIPMFVPFSTSFYLSPDARTQAGELFGCRCQPYYRHAS